MMKETQQWTSKIGFVLAAAGAAVGLGAIWKFPYVAGNGGRRILPCIFTINFIYRYASSNSGVCYWT